MRAVSNVWSRDSRRGGVMHLDRLLAVCVSAMLLAACGGGDADEAARAGESVPQATPQATAQATEEQQVALPPKLCDLLPKADAERVMGKALVEQRNDEWACHYRDAVGTTGTGLLLDRNVLPVGDQCRLVPDSEPVSGVGTEACIAIGVPVGLYSTLVFGSGGHTFEVRAPGQDRASELATPLARVVLSKLGS